MQAVARNIVAIYADRSTRQWIVRDLDGQFWALPSNEDPWEGRVPFDPTDETELEPVPGHYKCMLGLPA